MSGACLLKKPNRAALVLDYHELPSTDREELDKQGFGDDDNLAVLELRITISAKSVNIRGKMCIARMTDVMPATEQNVIDAIPE